MNIEALHNFNQHYQGDYPFLRQLNAEWRLSRPLAGKRILHNVAITRETMIKLEPLFLAGADVTVTHLRLPGLKPKQDCVELLNQIGAHVELDHQKISGEFDIALDCCGQIPAMQNVTISKGYVELTQSGTPVYSALESNLPIYSLDLSRLKCLEAMFGTGEACVRALKQFLTSDLEGRKFVLFGFGKVGRGIARYLSREGCELTIVDINEAHLQMAAANGFSVLSSKSNSALLDAINGACAVITATGQENLIEDLFAPTQIGRQVHLINMGADDEYGEQYAASRILGEKAPLNFLLDAPTTMYFIDPIFAAHNRCCDYILEGTARGFLPIPEALDLPIVREWSRRYDVDVSDIYD
jgi:adenosylhomocysteinase